MQKQRVSRACDTCKRQVHLQFHLWHVLMPELGERSDARESSHVPIVSKTTRLVSSRPHTRVEPSQKSNQHHWKNRRNSWKRLDTNDGKFGDLPQGGRTQVTCLRVLRMMSTSRRKTKTKSIRRQFTMVMILYLQSIRFLRVSMKRQHQGHILFHAEAVLFKRKPTEAIPRDQPSTKGLKITCTDMNIIKRTQFQLMETLRCQKSIHLSSSSHQRKQRRLLSTSISTSFAPRPCFYINLQSIDGDLSY